MPEWTELVDDESELARAKEIRDINAGKL